MPYNLGSGPKIKTSHSPNVSKNRDSAGFNKVNLRVFKDLFNTIMSEIKDLFQVHSGKKKCEGYDFTQLTFSYCVLSSEESGLYWPNFGSALHVNNNGLWRVFAGGFLFHLYDCIHVHNHHIVYHLYFCYTISRGKTMEKRKK